MIQFKLYIQYVDIFCACAHPPDFQSRPCLQDVHLAYPSISLSSPHHTYKRFENDQLENLNQIISLSLKLYLSDIIRYIYNWSTHLYDGRSNKMTWTILSIVFPIPLMMSWTSEPAGPGHFHSSGGLSEKTVMSCPKSIWAHWYHPTFLYITMNIVILSVIPITIGHGFVNVFFLMSICVFSISVKALMTLRGGGNIWKYLDSLTWWMCLFFSWTMLWISGW